MNKNKLFKAIICMRDPNVNSILRELVKEFRIEIFILGGRKLHCTLSLLCFSMIYIINNFSF